MKAHFDELHFSGGAGGQFSVTNMDPKCVDHSADGAVLFDDAGVLVSARLADKDSLSTAEQVRLKHILRSLSRLSEHCPRGAEHAGVCARFLSVGMKRVHALELLSSALTLAAVWTLAPFVHRCDQDSCISMPHWSSALGLSEQSKYLNSNLELR